MFSDLRPILVSTGLGITPSSFFFLNPGTCLQNFYPVSINVSRQFENEKFKFDSKFFYIWGLKLSNFERNQKSGRGSFRLFDFSTFCVPIEDNLSSLVLKYKLICLLPAYSNSYLLDLAVSRYTYIRLHF